MNIDPTTLKRISIIAEKLKDSSTLVDVLYDKNIIQEFPASITYNDIKVGGVINGTTLRVDVDVMLDDIHLECSILVTYKEPYDTFSSYCEIINVIKI